MFSARREVVRRGCTGLSQRVAVGGAQLLSRRGDSGPPGGLRGLSQTPEGSRTGWGRRAGGPPVAGVPGATARPRSPLAASQRQMLVVFRAAPGDSGCARGAGVCAHACAVAGVPPGSWVLLELGDGSCTLARVLVCGVQGPRPSFIHWRPGWACERCWRLGMA